MRYQDINNISNGDYLQLTEDYVFKTDFSADTIPKGTRMVVVGSCLQGFVFSVEHEKFSRLTLGKKRLHNMRLKKIGEVHL